MLQDLIAALDELGKPTEVQTTSDGTRLLLLPYGGRLLGMFEAHKDENFLWTNPILRDVERARAYYQADDWHNSGGDRTWIAPEVDFFLPDYPNLERYWQPRSLDPGNYQLSAGADELELSNHLSLTASRTGKEVELEIKKSFGPAPNPLRRDRSGNYEGVRYAGHTMKTSLRIVDDGGDATLVGLWSLTQMPHGGELFIPTYTRTAPKIYFGLQGELAGEVVSDENLVMFRMRAAGEHKIGVKAAAATGRIGYAYKAGDEHALLIRNFAVNPSAEYADVPWTDPDDVGYATQACSVNSRWGEFSELEYHVPAIGGATGLSLVEDCSQLWGFRGTREQINSVARVLLAPHIEIAGGR